MTHKPKVLFIGDTDENLPEFESFKKHLDCIKYTLSTKEQLLKDLIEKFHDIEGIYGGWVGFFPVKGVTTDMLQYLPHSLKMITLCSAGHDGYDHEGLRKRGILLCNTPTFGADQVADTALYLTLHSFRLFNVFENSLRHRLDTFKCRQELEESEMDPKQGKLVPNAEAKANSDQKVLPTYSFGHKLGGGLNIYTPAGKNAVIVGFGNIGKRIAKRLSAVGMNIHYVKRSKLTDQDELALKFPVTFHASIEDAAPLADVVIFALPGTPQTKDMLNAKVINLMPDRSRVINVGRGSIVNERDLLDGLQRGKLVFAGLDVFYTEPAVNPDLASRDDVVLIPHIASSTIEVFDATARFCLQNLENYLALGKDPANVVN